MSMAVNINCVSRECRLVGQASTEHSVLHATERHDTTFKEATSQVPQPPDLGHSAVSWTHWLRRNGPQPKVNKQTEIQTHQLTNTRQDKTSSPISTPQDSISHCHSSSSSPVSWPNYSCASASAPPPPHPHPPFHPAAAPPESSALPARPHT